MEFHGDQGNWLLRVPSDSLSPKEGAKEKLRLLSTIPPLNSDHPDSSGVWTLLVFPLSRNNFNALIMRLASCTNNWRDVTAIFNTSRSLRAT